MASSTDATTIRLTSGDPSHSHSVPIWSRLISLANGSAKTPSARTTATVSVKRCGGTCFALAVSTCRRAVVPRAAPAAWTASIKAGTRSSARSATMQQTLSVLHTLRSSEWITDDAKRAISALDEAINHAPPVPWRLTGTPACRATAPSWATASPEPRATANDSLRSSNNAHAVARDGESTRVTAAAGSPACASAGRSARSTIALAVPSASLPIRNTAVFPVRSTPAASANTFGRPSNTNPTTPSGARRAVTVQVSCSTTSVISLRAPGASRHTRRPAIMSARIDGDRTRRVVLRPRDDAAATSRSLAAAIAAKISSSASRRANIS